MMDLRTDHRKSRLVEVVVLRVKHNHRKVPSLPMLVDRKSADADACGVAQAWQESNR